MIIYSTNSTYHNLVSSKSMVVPAVTGVAAVHASTDDYDDPLL